MRKGYFAATSLGILLLAPSPANAAVTFNINNAVSSDGGTLTGWFTTSDDFKTLEDFSFTTSDRVFEWGPLLGLNYTMSDSFTWDPEYGIDASKSGGRSTLSVSFIGTLDATGVGIHSREGRLTKPGTPARVFTGSAVSAVPEPATWAMMIGGFGLIGAAMRRRAKLTAAYA